MEKHFAIPTKDLNVSKRFYERLGFSERTRWEKPDQQLIGIVLTDGRGFRIELVRHPKFSSVTFPEIPEVLHIGFDVPDAAAALEAAKAAGAEVLKPLTDGVSVKRFCFVRDPSGFPVEFTEPR